TAMWGHGSARWAPRRARSTSSSKTRSATRSKRPASPGPTCLTSTSAGPALIDAEFRPEERVDGLRIGLAAARLHHLADEPAEERRLRLGLLGLVGVACKDLGDDLLDGA